MNALIALLSRLPMPVLHGLAAVAYVLCYRVLGLRRQVLRDNLRRVFPELSEAERERLARASYRHLADIVAQVAKALTIAPEELLRRVEVRGAEVLEAHFAAGRSVMLLSAHYGNWEWANLVLCLTLSRPLHVAYKPPHDARGDALLKRLRCRFGSEAIPAKTLPRDIVRRRGTVRALALVADQVPTSSQSRTWLTFLGQPTAFYPGPGKLAHSTGDPVVYCDVRRVRRGHYAITLSELTDPGAGPLEPDELTARYAAAVERTIRESPAEWLWIHRRWKLTPPTDVTATS